MYFLIAYDIADPKRLTKVSKIMEDFGVRVQLSVFEAELGVSSLNRMIAKLEDVIEEEVDGIKIFELCERCFSKRWAIGHDIDLGINRDYDYEIL